MICVFFYLTGLNNEEYQVVIGNDTTRYIVDDLEPAQNYTFYIVAYMPMGASRMSDHVIQHTLEDGEDWIYICVCKSVCDCVSERSEINHVIVVFNLVPLSSPFFDDKQWDEERKGKNGGRKR